MLDAQTATLHGISSFLSLEPREDLNPAEVYTSETRRGKEGMPWTSPDHAPAQELAGDVYDTEIGDVYEDRCGGIVRPE